VVADESALRAKLAKLEGLFRRAGTEGERAAAGDAMGRIQDRLSSHAPTGPALEEIQFSFSDPWSVRLFVALCRKHGLKPYRYPRQRRTTLVVRGYKPRIDATVWREFTALHAELAIYFAETVDHLIQTAMRSDGDDAALAPTQLL
jgi:hypothetical protein